MNDIFGLPFAGKPSYNGVNERQDTDNVHLTTLMYHNESKTSKSIDYNSKTQSKIVQSMEIDYNDSSFKSSNRDKSTNYYVRN